MKHIEIITAKNQSRHLNIKLIKFIIANASAQCFYLKLIL